MQRTLCPKCYNAVELDLDTCPYCGLDIRPLRETAELNYGLNVQGIDRGIKNAEKGDFRLLRNIAHALTFESISLSPVRLDQKLGLSLLTKLDELGDADAKCWIGEAYLQGICCEKNQDKALQCFREAAENDSILAYQKLGDFYRSSDPKRAFKMYQIGAKRGDVCCSHQLGLFYIKGEECEQDIDHALSLFSVSSSSDDGGIDEGCFSNAASLLYKQNDLDNAFKVLNYAQRKSFLDEDGYILLGSMYKNEDYPGYDLDKAKELFEEAYEIFDSAQAANALELISCDGDESNK